MINPIVSNSSWYNYKNGYLSSDWSEQEQELCNVYLDFEEEIINFYSSIIQIQNLPFCVLEYIKVVLNGDYQSVKAANLIFQYESL